MTDLTNHNETQILEHNFGNTQMETPPNPVYIALHTEDPTEEGNVGEIDSTATNYDREPVATDGGFTITDNSAENAEEINFGTADSTWGDVSHFSIWTAADDTGNALWYSALDQTKTIEANDEIRFDPGALTATID